MIKNEPTPIFPLGSMKRKVTIFRPVRKKSPESSVLLRNTAIPELSIAVQGGKKTLSPALPKGTTNSISGPHDTNGSSMSENKSVVCVRVSSFKAQTGL